jgi:amidase
MPTLPVKATPLPAADASREEYIQRAFEMIFNTAPFDVTGHPALTIPCAMRDGLPVGVMLIGKHFQESTLYQVANAYEQGADWKTA